MTNLYILIILNYNIQPPHCPPPQAISLHGTSWL